MERLTPTTRWFRDLLLMGALVATLVVALGTAENVRRDGLQPMTLGEQFDRYKLVAERDGFKVHELGAWDLRGTGDLSRVVSIDPAVPSRRVGERLEIYDVRGDTLHRTVVFAAANWRTRFQHVTTADVDGSGTADVIGGFARLDPRDPRRLEHRGTVVPVAISYHAGAYELRALDLGAPGLRRSPQLSERQYQDVYAARWRFASSTAGRPVISGHPVQVFTVSEQPYRLLAGWFRQPPLRSYDVASYEMNTWIFDTQDNGVLVRPCSFTGGLSRIVVRFASLSRQPEKAFAEAYGTLAKSRICVPVGDAWSAPAQAIPQHQPKVLTLLPRVGHHRPSTPVR